MGSIVRKESLGTVDLERQPRVLVGCRLCGSTGSRLICSLRDIAAQQRFLESFYRSHWSRKNTATATDRIHFTQDYSTAIVTCTDCGLLYRNPRPQAQAVAQAYASEQYEDDYLRAELDAQRRWARTRIPLVARHLAKGPRRSPPRILEVGSFVGGFLLEGRNQGWDMVGVDPGHDVAAFCRDRGLPIFEGTLEEARFAPGSFDAVVVWNTFDQLPDPRPLLEQAIVLLRNGGLLVVRVPNGAYFAWMLWMRSFMPSKLRRLLDIAMACNNLLTFPYLYGYSARQLERLTAPYGFRLATCVPDEVVSTPPGHLALWARAQERAVKTLFRVIATLWPDDRSRQYRSAPWLDCVFERACTDREREDAELSLGVVPVYSPLVFEDTGFTCPRHRWDREGGF
jgi:SAM-dependent methyltransferase